MYNACKHGRVETLKKALSHPNINLNSVKCKGCEQCWNPLITACQNNQLEAVRWLLQQEGVDVNARNQWWATPLLIAVQNNNVPIVKLLLDRHDIKVNVPSIRGEKPLLAAIYNDHLAIVKMLLATERRYNSIRIRLPKRDTLGIGDLLLLRPYKDHSNAIGPWRGRQSAYPGNQVTLVRCQRARSRRGHGDVAVERRERGPGRRKWSYSVGGGQLSRAHKRRQNASGTLR